MASRAPLILMFAKWVGTALMALHPPALALVLFTGLAQHHVTPCLIESRVPPLWLLLSFLACVMATVAAAGFEEWVARREVRGHCPACAYDLAGSPGGVCPECGTAKPAAAATPK